MRILYLSQYFPPEPGAPAARVSELSRAWAKAGHHVTVLTGMPHHPTGIVPREYRRKAFVREAWQGVNVLRTWMYASANSGRLRRSASYASFALSASITGILQAERPDVLIATSPQFLCAVAGGAVSYARGLPFVFEVRDLWPESIVAVGALKANHPLIRGLEVLEKKLYQAADAVVVVTNAFQTKLRERGVANDKLSVIENGADLGRFSPRSRSTPLRRELGLGDRFVAVYAGTHGMAHGLNSVLDVAQKLRSRDDVRFLFVGEGAERASLEERARRDNLSNVTFLGGVSRDRMPEVYATSDLCLVPLRKAELFTTVLPSKMFEIMAMERPVALSVDGEARRILDASGGGFFVEPEDGSALADEIVRLTRDRERAVKMGCAGREFVLREFDRQSLAMRYLQLLEQLKNRSDSLHRSSASSTYAPN